MSEDNLFPNLLSLQVPSKPQRKEVSSDILNSLCTLDLPVPKKKENQMKKNKHEEELHQYISSVNKNKTTVAASKPKQQNITKSSPAINKTTSSSHSVKTSTPKPIERVNETKQSKYMPTVVDIFAKKEDKSSKPKNSGLKSESYRPKQTEEKSKVQAKKDKIQHKQLQKNNKSKSDKLTTKPENHEKSKKYDIKQVNVQKERAQKKKKESSSSSSESSSSSSQSQSESQDWRKKLRNITGYNPGDKKFRERDHMIIKQSGVDRIFGEDKFSFKMGRREQEEDLRLQQLHRLKKLKKQQHRDRH